MKMRKLILIVSVLACLLSLSGCGSKENELFLYNNKDVAVRTMDLFQQYVGVPETAKEHYMKAGTEFEKSAIKGIDQAENTDKVGEFENYQNYSEAIEAGMFNEKTVGFEVVEGKDYISASILNKAQNRDVKITVKYVESSEFYIEYDKMALELQNVVNQIEAMGSDTYTAEAFFSQYGYDGSEDLNTWIPSFIESQLESQGVYRLEAQEMVVAAVYSKGELLGQAGRNTIIGMGTVFIVLIFISFIISLFKFLPALFAPKPKKPEAKPTPKVEPVKTVAPVAVANDNLMDDKELVAVITAAVYAASSASNGGAVSKDKLIVRSIRRANR